MKKILFLSFLILLTLPVPIFSSQEGILVENIVSSKTQTSSFPDSFSIIVTGNGKLIVKPGQVFTEGKEEPGTILPYLISDPKPIPYPEQAMAQGWQGKIVVAVEILANGSVGLYQVTHSTGYQILDEVAIQAVQNWKFHPAVKANGQLIRTCIQIPITFQLEDE